MSTVGIIFSNISDAFILELTHNRTTGSVPFGGRYRLIDFVLSNMVNSGITKVGVITKTNYQSLMDHIGSGKEWDLARKTGGLRLLPPFGEKNSDSLYSSRLEALKGALSFIGKSTEEYILLSDCDIVYNADFTDMIEYHEQKGADITLAFHEDVLSYEASKKITTLKIDDNGKVKEIITNPYKEGKALTYMKVIVMKRTLLLQLVGDAVSRGKTSFEKDILSSCVNEGEYSVFGYQYDGFYATVNSIQSYYKSNMEILDRKERDLLFNAVNRPIYTKVKDSPPTKYGEEAKVSNSFIADGCIIEGEVKNSILFRGCRISKGAKVSNCILMQDTNIGEKADVNAVITDKNVIIHDKVNLSGHPSLPFYIAKNKII